MEWHILRILKFYFYVCSTAKKVGCFAFYTTPTYKLSQKKSRRATSKTGFAFYTTPTYKLSKKK